MVYLSDAGSAGMKWLGDTGKRRQLIKRMSSSQLLQWALEFGPPSKHQGLVQNTHCRIINITL